jgi:very-short-patch-repair endonuclease
VPVAGQRVVSFQRDSGSATHGVKVLGVRRELSISGWRDERIAAVAAHQRGRIAYRQLQAIAVSPSSVAWLVTRGRLLPSLRGVFIVGHGAPTDLAAETEALLSVRDGAALSHWSAAALWRLCTPSPAVVHVTTAGSSNAAINRGVKVHRSRILEPRDVRIKLGLQVVSPARALLDIAPEASYRQLELAFDRGIVDRVLRPADVADVLTRAGGHRGRKRLATVLARQTAGTTMTRSEAEERVLALIRSARLAEPLVNATVAGYEVDFYWPQDQFALEMDGFQYHSGRGAFERDRRKDNDLRKAGVTAMRTTWWQLEAEPYALVADLAREVQAAGGSSPPG